MVALTLLDPGTLLAIAGALATAWGLSRAGTSQAWKSTAEGRGEELADMKDRLSRAEAELTVMRDEIVRLESLPDYSEVMLCLRKIEETLSEISERWG